MFGFAMIDIPVFFAGLAIGLRYKDNFVGAWQHLVAWIHGAESYAAYLEGKAAKLVRKADAVKSAAASAATTFQGEAVKTAAAITEAAKS